MVLELHVFGPAFGLPSIDAECLATIVYLRKCFAQHDITKKDRSWHLVGSSNVNVSPFRKLPALRIRDDVGRQAAGHEDKDKDLWVAGFDNITAYLKERTNGNALDRDAELDELQQADGYALSSFIRSHGAPLLDLSLYVSSENYNTCTRPALGELLYWPESWIVPHQLRENARRRSEHLGLSALDVDAAKEQQEREDNQGLAAHLPKSLRKPRQTVSGLLGRSAQQTKFRLEAVTEDFLEPLSGKLGGLADGQGMLGSGLHSVDCLAIAYLTLMQQPELPQSWLQKILETKYSNLSRWASKHAQDVFGPTASVKAAAIGESSEIVALPWLAPSAPTISQRSLTAVESLVSTIPGLRFGYESIGMQPAYADWKQSRRDQQLVYAATRKRQILYSQIITSTLATTSILAWLVHSGFLTFSKRNSNLQ